MMKIAGNFCRISVSRCLRGRSGYMSSKIFLMFSLLDTGWPLTNTNLDEDRMTHVSGECGEIRGKVRQALQSKLDAQKQAEERKKKK
jgi:hypothetical protein